jgi:hypothetical protein
MPARAKMKEIIRRAHNGWVKGRRWKRVGKYWFASFKAARHVGMK